MHVRVPRRLDRLPVAPAGQAVAVGLEQELVVAAVDAQADRAPVGVDRHVDRLVVGTGSIVSTSLKYRQPTGPGAQRNSSVASTDPSAARTR